MMMRWRTFLFSIFFVRTRLRKRVLKLYTYVIHTFIKRRLTSRTMDPSNVQKWANSLRQSPRNLFQVRFFSSSFYDDIWHWCYWKLKATILITFDPCFRYNFSTNLILLFSTIFLIMNLLFNVTESGILSIGNCDHFSADSSEIP